MATSAIRAGQAYVEIFVEQGTLVTGLARARRHFLSFAADTIDMLRPSKWASAIGNEMAGLGRRMAVFGSSTALAFAPTIKAASDAAETINKFRAVFKDQSEAAERFAAGLSKSLGRSKYEILDTLSAFQAFFVGLEFDPKQARQMSQQLESLVVDFGSFFNVADDEAMRRFLSALSGSSEVMDQFGINLKQAAIEAELLREGVKKEWQEVTEAEKATARFNIILRSMTAQGAVGDATRTAGSFANQLKALKGQIRDAATEIGAALLPSLTPVVSKAVTAAKAFGEWAKSNPEFISQLGSTAVNLAAVGVALYAVGKALAIGGTILGTVFTLGLLVKIGSVVIPVMWKLAAAIKLTTVSLAGLRLAITTFGPTILATSFAVGALVATLGAVAIAFGNAKIQGITLGESVLDLTHKITGLDNAYSRLQDTTAQQKAATDIVRGLDSAVKGSDLAGLDSGIKQLREHRSEVIKAMREAINSPGDDLPNWQVHVRGLVNEVKRLDLMLASFGKQRGGVAIRDWFRTAASDAANIGKTIGEGLLEGMKTVWNNQGKALKEFMPGLLRSRAEGIADDRQRELALINADYDERARQAQEEALPTTVLEQTRQQELQNARDRWEREDAAKRKQHASQLAYEIAQADIEATLKGKEKERALLEAEHRRAVEEAQAEGLDTTAIDRLYALRANAIEIGDMATGTRGTFSAMAAMRFGGSTAADRTAEATEETAEHAMEIVEKLDMFLTAV